MERSENSQEIKMDNEMNIKVIVTYRDGQIETFYADDVDWYQYDGNIFVAKIGATTRIIPYIFVRKIDYGERA